MSALKVVDRWWSKRAPIFLGGALLVLAIMTVMLYIGQLQSADANSRQTDQIASLAKALDDQREAAREGGAKVVAPPASEIKEDPNIVKGVKGNKGDTGASGSSGPSGPPGSSGQPGSSGTPGSEGTDGINGQNGANGANGADGADGTNGADGVGQVGPTGPPGPTGPAGTDGTDGKDGADGQDGKSPSSIRIPIGAITYVCTPTGSGSTDYTCAPELGDGGSQVSAKVARQSGSLPIPVHPAAILPALAFIRRVKVG